MAALFNEAGIITVVTLISPYRKVGSSSGGSSSGSGSGGSGSGSGSGK